MSLVKLQLGKFLALGSEHLSEPIKICFVNLQHMTIL